jgi:uracil-DNA glycosylase
MRNELKIGKEADYGEVPPVPATSDLGELRRKAAKCQACPLFRNATQTVFGEGGAGVVVFIGEQPGDQEDKVGKPFVGPAGQILAAKERAFADFVADLNLVAKSIGSK